MSARQRWWAMLQVVLQLVDLPIQVVPQRQSLDKPQKADYSTPNRSLQKGGESGALGGLKGLLPRGPERLPAEFALSFNPGVGE